MKKIAYHNQTEKEALEYTSKIVDFGVTLIVYAALNELASACAVLQQSGHFKKRIKSRANNALRMRNNKVIELREIVLDHNFAETYWDAVIDACEEDVQKLRDEIKATLDEGRSEESEFYAEIETARIMLGAAKIHYETAISDCTNKFLMKDAKGMRRLDLFALFHEFYIDSIYREWNAVCDELYKNRAEQLLLQTNGLWRRLTL